MKNKIKQKEKKEKKKFLDSMWVIHQDENERHSSRKADIVDVVIYARKIGRYVKGESNRKYEEQEFELYNNRVIFSRLKEKI